MSSKAWSAAERPPPRGPVVRAVAPPARPEPRAALASMLAGKKVGAAATSAELAALLGPAC